MIPSSTVTFIFESLFSKMVTHSNKLYVNKNKCNLKNIDFNK